MVTRKQILRGRHHALLFGSIGMLAVSSLLQSCADNNVSPTPKPGDPRSVLNGGGTGVGFGNIDISDVFGFAQADLHFLHDDRIGDDEGVYYRATLWNTNGRVDLTTATADGASLRYTPPGVVSEGYSPSGTQPGGTSTWTLRGADGTHLTNASISVPTRPVIVSPSCYQHVSASRDLNVRINSSVTGGDAVVMLVYDSYRDQEFGLLDTPPVGSTVASRTYTTADDGALEIPASTFNGLARGRVYDLIVYRWRYQTYDRSDGRKMGIVADTKYAIPIILTD